MRSEYDAHAALAHAAECRDIVSKQDKAQRVCKATGCHWTWARVYLGAAGWDADKAIANIKRDHAANLFGAK